MPHHEITFPTDEATVRKLRAGDTVTIQGHIIGIRDATQIRIFDRGQEPPMPLAGAALLHTAPGVRKLADGRYEPMCIGTTTSARMSRFTEGLVRDHHARAIIGKLGANVATLAGDADLQRQDAQRRQASAAPVYGGVDETARALAGSGTPRRYCAAAVAAWAVRFRPYEFWPR